jgi:hypothetical protein
MDFFVHNMDVDSQMAAHSRLQSVRSEQQ